MRLAASGLESPARQALLTIVAEGARGAGNADFAGDRGRLGAAREEQVLRADQEFTTGS